MRFLLSLALVLALAVPAMAAPTSDPFVPPAGWSKPAKHANPYNIAKVTWAAQVNFAPDDTPVELTGLLVRRVHKEKYLFEDASGSVTVDIDDDLDRRHQLAPGMRVRLFGEVDHKSRRDNQVDVKWLEQLR